MRKIIAVILTFIMAIVLISCGDKMPNETPILFSKLMTESYFDVSAIELYNPSEEEVNLAGHTINIYQSSTRTIDTTINLKGKIAAKSFFFIVNDLSVEEAKNRADFVYKGRQLRGSEAITLVYNKVRVDNIGVIGSGIEYINPQEGSTYVRKPDRLIQRKEFIISDYIEFVPNLYEMLGKTEIPITEEDFIYGPRLTENDRKNTFYLNNNKLIGGGGVAEVSVISFGDGDTTTFRYPEHLAVSGSTRYYYIDTPETQQTRIEPYGYIAANFTNNFLRDAINYDLKIEVQTMKGLSTDGSFGRFFGNVYVDGYSLSYILIRMGLAKSSASTSVGLESETNYKNMTVESWMRQADYYAIENKLGIHGTVVDESHFGAGNNNGNNLGYRPFIIKPYERSSARVVTNEAEIKDAIASNVETIELANDIVLNDALVIENKKNIRIAGFANKLTTKDEKSAVIVIEKSEGIYIDNIKLSNGEYGLSISNSEVFINGYMEFIENKVAAIKLSNSKLLQGADGKDYIKDAFYLKFANDLEELVIFDESSTVKLTTIFRNQKLEEIIENYRKVIKLIIS